MKKQRESVAAAIEEAIKEHDIIIEECSVRLNKINDRINSLAILHQEILKGRIKNAVEYAARRKELFDNVQSHDND
jgi:two-component sensor histidine kinase